MVENMMAFGKVFFDAIIRKIMVKKFLEFGYHGN